MACSVGPDTEKPGLVARGRAPAVERAGSGRARAAALVTLRGRLADSFEGCHLAAQ